MSTVNVGDCNLMGTMVLSKLQEISDRLLHLENYTFSPDYMPFQGDNEEMATRINRKVTVNGSQHWIRANTEQEYAEKLLRLTGAVCESGQQSSKHSFSEFAWNWFETYSKPNISTVTAVTYERQLALYLIPYFGDKAIEDISTDDIQRLFNDMNGAKATKDKTKQVLNMILDTALDDGIILRNPLRSKRLRVTGEASKATQPYSLEQMRFLIQNLDKVKRPLDRAYLALQALHPLRLEEVLGLKWEDIDTKNMVLHVRRAVTHPKRSKPEIKAPKTDASKRPLGLSGIALQYLIQGNDNDFVLGGSDPLTYQQVRKMCERIQADTGFTERITPIRFRTTVLTDLYDITKDVKQVQAAAGHATSAMTLERYIKGRSDVSATVAVIDSTYGVSC